MKLALFDQLVGAGGQCRRDSEAKRLGSFEVDRQIELCGRFDGRVCGASSLGNAPEIVACAPEHGWVIRSIRHQPADLHKLACAEQRGNRIFVGESYDRFSASEGHRIRKHEQPSACSLMMAANASPNPGGPGTSTNCKSTPNKGAAVPGSLN